MLGKKCFKCTYGLGLPPIKVVKPGALNNNIVLV